MKRTLKAEGLVVNKKEKYLFRKGELVVFTNKFWTVDDAQFIHLRNKIQIPFLISVFYWTGARIGAFFSDNYDKKGGGLRYRVSGPALVKGQFRSLLIGY